LEKLIIRQLAGVRNMVVKNARVMIGGIPTDCVTSADLVQLLQTSTEDTGAQLMFDINGHGLALAQHDDVYRRDLLQADIIHADGQPLVFASRVLTRSPIPERTATTDLFHDVAAAAQASGKTFYLLGGTQQVVTECAAKMQSLYPRLKIVGARNGYFTEAEEGEVCKAINESGADIIWVGLGKPKEQAFCVRNRARLTSGWLVTCGGCFNYVTGHYPRAPDWMQRNGLEWFHRMVTQPRKLGWRYFSTTPVALYLLFARTGDLKTQK
jgi:exopolysaccharide biosynthesis WecB/TagA/CpsF family protein